MSKVGEASSQGDTDKKLELLLSIVTEMKSNIKSMSTSVDIVVNLALMNTGGACPSTFVLKPKAMVTPTPSPGSSGRTMVLSYIKRNIRNPSCRCCGTSRS
jgi:hypothetical protein